MGRIDIVTVWRKERKAKIIPKTLSKKLSQDKKVPIQ